MFPASAGQSARMADEESEFEILAEGGTPEEQDLHILEVLEEHGADLAESREIRVFLHFATEADADAAAEELTEAGYEIASFESPGDELPWTVRAAMELRIDRDNVNGFRSRFNDLAERHAGDFDG